MGYVGTQTVRSFADLEINAAAPAAALPGVRCSPASDDSIDTWAWNGYLSANYHALQASFNHRAGHGLLLKGAYTFSKAINFTDEDGWTGTINWNWGPVFYRNRALAGYDIPHSLPDGFVYECRPARGRSSQIQAFRAGFSATGR